jgi:hypothetical protein
MGRPLTEEGRPDLPGRRPICSSTLVPGAGTQDRPYD